jgi:hypothetical protein
VPDVPLSAEDHQSAADAGRTLHERGWRKVFTVNEQVDAWRAVVESVVDGYRLTIDDYTNDLSVREWLEQVQPLLTARARDSLASRLVPLDERFRAATTVTPRHLPGGGTGWWYRLPNHLTGELADDVARMGLPGSQ